MTWSVYISPGLGGRSWVDIYIYGKPEEFRLNRTHSFPSDSIKEDLQNVVRCLEPLKTELALILIEENLGAVGNVYSQRLSQMYPKAEIKTLFITKPLCKAAHLLLWFLGAESPRKYRSEHTARGIIMYDHLISQMCKTMKDVEKKFIK